MANKLSMTQFIAFLRNHAGAQISGNVDDRPWLQGKDEAYRDILRIIDVFLRDYAEQKTLTKEAEKAIIQTIETDARRQFDDPLQILKHIHEIASRPPFFDSERISLAAIDGFCTDFIHRHNIKVKNELIASAPF